MGLTKINTNLRYKNFKEKNKTKEMYYSKDNKKNIFDDSFINEELKQIFDDSEKRAEKVEEKNYLEIINKIENNISSSKRNKNTFDEFYNKENKENKGKKENKKIEQRENSAINIEILRNESSLKFNYSAYEEENKQKIEGVSLQININSGNVLHLI